MFAFRELQNFRPDAKAPSALALAEFAGLTDHTKLLPFVKTIAKELDICIQFNLALIDEGPFQNLFYVSGWLFRFIRNRG